MTTQIDLAFKVICRLCGGVTEFDLASLHPDHPSRCRECGHTFTVSHDLALSLRRRVEEFLRTIPEEDKNTERDVR